jgi:alkanesulfonate monooxygenase SsuD/methylene tetrahydromethanopterin reductase-like flavin-dependent oxidoreductase (luciferase family)
MARPDVGIFLPSISAPDGRPGDIAAAARHAEGLGLESVWAVDQLIGGRGAPIVESTVALAAAAGATSRVRLGFGVLILPLRPAAWVAKQVASLQYVSGGRVLLGVGVGGDRHEASWAAAGVPRQERGRRADAALRVLPALISGRPACLPGGAEVRLAPPAPVPPILVGGMSGAALRRAAEHGDGWFAMQAAVPPDALARLAGLAAGRGRPTPEVTASMMVALRGDPALPDAATLARQLADPDGPFGIPAERVPELLVTGDPDDIAARLADSARSGAARVVVTVTGGDWHRQAELLAEARSRLG